MAGRDLHHDFLPAALEVQQTPPTPLGRIILWAIAAFFIIAVVWAIVGHVDVVAIAQGKIVPSDRVKIIQPVELATVRAIHVTEGQAVDAGQLLIELDTTLNAADLKRMQQELLAAQLEQARLNALLNQLDNPAAQPHWPEHASPLHIATHTRLLASELAEHHANTAALQAELKRQDAELQTIRTGIAKRQATLPLVTQRAEAMNKLQAKGMAATQAYLELEQERLEQSHDLKVQQARIAEIQASREEVAQRLNAARSQFQRQTTQRLAETEQKVAALEQETIKADRRNEWQQIRAPIAGQVQQLAIHTVGGVVQPAQELLRIVPQDEQLEVEAWLANKDIGFVHEQQEAAVKIETFPFTKYGTIASTIRRISDDAVPDEKLGLVYATTATLERNTIEVNGKPIKLTPGMAVTVEVKTGQRRIIEYILAPLLRYKQESIRER